MPPSTHILIIETLMKFLHLRDVETSEHTRRVAQLAVEFACAIKGFSDADLTNVYYSALLHDAGKIGIPDAILKKKRKLTRQEMKVIQKHPQYTYDLFYAISGFEGLLDIAYCHHEKWDGTGYPRKLKGDDIPLKARLFAVVDVWDALTSDRCYRPAWSDRQAHDYILRQSGIQFDPAIVEAFISHFHLFAHASVSQLRPTEMQTSAQARDHYVLQI